jgi:hypothetical protein
LRSKVPDTTAPEFRWRVGVASFGDIRLQETADNAYGAVVNSSVVIGYPAGATHSLSNDS